MFTTAIFLNVLSLAVVSAWFTLLLQWPVSRAVLRRIPTVPAALQKTLLTAWVMLPIIIGLFCSIAFILNAFTDVMWAPLEMFIHWHHLFEFEWLTWHGGLLGVWSVATVWILARHVWLVWAHRASLQSALMMADGSVKHHNGYEFVCLQTAMPLAFTAGMLRPQVYLSQGLLERFDDAQLQCILAHEAAHQRQRDPLQKWLFSLASAYYPASLRRTLRNAFDLASELQADSRAGRETGALNVASALVAFGKSERQWQMPLAVSFGQDFVSQRVRFLIEPATFNMTIPATIGLVALAVLTANLLSMDSLHHYIELILER
ncbi:MAG: M48 family metalloprotease [Gammaproteobacteria bacterium]|nr:M48 family metalloprotease [Gammaproteobacteria bacterium]